MKKERDKALLKKNFYWKRTKHIKKYYIRQKNKKGRYGLKKREKKSRRIQGWNDDSCFCFKSYVKAPKKVIIHFFLKRGLAFVCFFVDGSFGESDESYIIAQLFRCLSLSSYVSRRNFRNCPDGLYSRRNSNCRSFKAPRRWLKKEY
uniref:Ribosomal protein S14 n=1 Tax=Panagrolaimus sp. ES5 TaxID=591445 RepID=A0AC34GJ35_9BILA